MGKIVEKAGGSVLIDDLLVGFKYVADVLKSLERQGCYRQVTCSPKDLVLAAEESHGVIMVPTIRDKDATPACMYLAALYQMLRRQGQTLLDYYVGLLEKFGGYDTVNRSLTMTGAEGIIRKDRIMEHFRKSPPAALGGSLYDCVIADPVVIPPEHEADYREPIERLHSFFINDYPRTTVGPD